MWSVVSFFKGEGVSEQIKEIDHLLLLAQQEVKCPGCGAVWMSTVGLSCEPTTKVRCFRCGEYWESEKCAVVKSEREVN